MADHTGMADHPSVPDYDLDDALQLTEPEQYRALFEPTRSLIVTLLSERAATTSEIAEALDRPKGTVGHHLKALEAAGLVRVVRTVPVRALVAKYYGRTARTFYYDDVGEASGEPQRVLGNAAREITEPTATGARGQAVVTANRRYARIPHERAQEWAERLNELMLEFEREPRGGGTTYAVVFGLYPADRRGLPAPDADEAP